MKLFQRLLVAPAALGLISPIAANATEINLNEIANYSDVENIELANSFDSDQPNKSLLLAGGEGLADTDSYDGGFSETTTASFSVDFAIGAVDGRGTTTTITDGDEDLQATYGFQIDLNTSFTGEDSLDISLDAGNGNGSLGEFDLNGPATTDAANEITASDILTVDGISYTFPLGGATAFVGDNTDGSMLFTTACVYGGPSNTLDDCGNVTAGITGGGLSIGAAYDFDNGFTTAFGAQFSETGIATDETDDSYALNAAYISDSYGASITYANIEDGNDNDTYMAFNGYYSFDNGLNISAGYEIGDLDNAAATVDETEAYFVGINGEVGPGELGAAAGTAGRMVETATGIPDRMMYEIYYSYAVNDGMTITPLIYTVEADPGETGDLDETGIMVKTSFSF
ncbi:hypothetical protein [Prochlorococcus marinus]|jgi:hypothetical protein|uniref:Possible porin n=1 Tax=Prochlorococcus marinus (strain MIT 9301) TaxID=167546 RepID=A3PDM4_PROM0|nr:hypothetical protein [Prochlorococcus marinus]ABO17849.1 possible porin [Prochlorococcus marinus str. MIT 9301]